MRFSWFGFLFPVEEAKANAPCVIFIDELDSVGGKRIESPMHPYSRQTINQLLAEMDGLVVCAVVKVITEICISINYSYFYYFLYNFRFKPNEGVIVIGATNFAEALDK